jgi:hypothetical protein
MEFEQRIKTKLHGSIWGEKAIGFLMAFRELFKSETRHESD